MAVVVCAEVFGSMSLMSRRSLMFAAAVLGAAVLTAGAMIASVAEASSVGQVLHHQSWILTVSGL